jgi:pimeloyl-ACP methyl ester carboxylesterase
MHTLSGRDGTRLAYHRAGAGEPLICLPGGPMQASAYLGDLGGLSDLRTLVLLDLRGTGDSEVPREAATYRCDRQVADVEALRVDLALDRIDLLAHSAGASLALLYAARYPERIGRLVLLNPSPRALAVVVSDADRRERAELRRGEPWFPDAWMAFERIWSGEPTAADWTAITPFTYGRWDRVTQAHAALADRQRNGDAAAIYYGAGAIDPVTLRSELEQVPFPTSVVAGEYDVALPPRRAAELAALLPDADLHVQPRAGHFPWLDDPDLFVEHLAGRLS